MRFPKELGRCDSCHFPEKPGEMVRIVESQEVSCLIDIMSVHQEVLALLYHERMDVAYGGSACRLVDDITKITC